MARTILDQELREINGQIIQLGEKVECAFGDALLALRTKDVSLCERVIAGDMVIDSLRAAIEQRTFRVLTMQQPLGGKDLRFLASVFSIVGDLERVGDGSKGIAQMAIQIIALGGRSLDDLNAKEAENNFVDIKTFSLRENMLLMGLLELGDEARRVLRGTVGAFAQRDSGAAQYLWEEDDVVDVRYHQVRHDLMSLLSGLHAVPALREDARIMQRATYYMWIAHKLERLGDHCGNICERLVFIVQGERQLKYLSHEG